MLHTLEIEQVKLSDQALALAEKIAVGRENFIPLEDYANSDFYIYYHEMNFGGYITGREHRVIALCLYAAMLKDEGK